MLAPESGLTLFGSSLRSLQIFCVYETYSRSRINLTAEVVPLAINQGPAGAQNAALAVLPGTALLFPVSHRSLHAARLKGLNHLIVIGRLDPVALPEALHLVDQTIRL